jgi:hypothetical protein
MPIVMLSRYFAKHEALLDFELGASKATKIDRQQL